MTAFVVVLYFSPQNIEVSLCSVCGARRSEEAVAHPFVAHDGISLVRLLEVRHNSGILIAAYYEISLVRLAQVRESRSKRQPHADLHQNVERQDSDP